MPDPNQIGYAIKVARNEDGTFTVSVTKRDGTPHPEWSGSLTAEKGKVKEAFAAHVKAKAPLFAKPTGPVTPPPATTKSKQ